MRWLLAIVAGTIIVGMVAVLAMGLYVYPRDDVPEDPDVVVVLGGAGAERAELGIALANTYDVPLVLSSSASIFGERQGRDCDVDAICFEPDPANTAGEAANMADMAAEQGWDHVVVATSAFHTSRSRFLFNQCLGRDRVSVVGAIGERRGRTSPALMLRESLGIVAGATFARAC
jgi:uncharacterized SAM-binding protein YcdF (DUF218 family)